MLRAYFENSEELSPLSFEQIYKHSIPAVLLFRFRSDYKIGKVEEKFQKLA